jgi:peroxiredoxin family protein
MDAEAKKAERVSIVLHSGDMDKLYSALIIGNGALAMGMDASIFFTFWGLQRLRKDDAWAMPPAGLDKGSLSKMNMLGLGRRMMQQRMSNKNVASLERLMADFRDLGGRIIACDMTMDIMGVRKEDLREDLIDDFGGVGTFIQEARDSAVTLFI